MDLIPDSSRGIDAQRNDAVPTAHRPLSPEARFARTLQRLGFSPSLVTPRLGQPQPPRPRRLRGDPAGSEWRPL